MTSEILLKIEHEVDKFMSKDSGYSTLDENNNVIPCNLREWGQLYQTKEGQKKRQVAVDEIDGYQVSTVFLGLDHSFGSGNPLWFETMIFGEGNGDQYQMRSTTWKEAEQMHNDAIQWIKDGCKYDD
jgi:hypothetical protein